MALSLVTVFVATFKINSVLEVVRKKHMNPVLSEPVDLNLIFFFKGSQFIILKVLASLSPAKGKILIYYNHKREETGV